MDVDMTELAELHSDIASDYDEGITSYAYGTGIITPNGWVTWFPGVLNGWNLLHKRTQGELD